MCRKQTIKVNAVAKSFLALFDTYLVVTEEEKKKRKKKCAFFSASELSSKLKNGSFDAHRSWFWGLSRRISIFEQRRILPQNVEAMLARVRVCMRYISAFALSACCELSFTLLQTNFMAS